MNALPGIDLWVALFSWFHNDKNALEDKTTVIF